VAESQAHGASKDLVCPARDPARSTTATMTRSSARYDSIRTQT
jgi:hypothetical protein